MIPPAYAIAKEGGGSKVATSAVAGQQTMRCEKIFLNAQPVSVTLADYFIKQEKLLAVCLIIKGEMKDWIFYYCGNIKYLFGKFSAAGKIFENSASRYRH